MPGDRTVVSNTSSLLNLALIDRLDLLDSQFDGVVVPEQVWSELAAGEEGLQPLETRRGRGDIEVEPIENRELFIELAAALDEGEAAAIAYAIEHDADLLLLDEREGRKAARRHDIPVTGVIGILLEGVENDSVDIEIELDRLREAGFWISDELYEEVLDRVDSNRSDDES